MVWGGITQETRTPLHIFDRGITGAIYTQDVLATHMVPFLNARPGMKHTCSRTTLQLTPAGQPGSFYRQLGFSCLSGPPDRLT